MHNIFSLASILKRLFEIELRWFPHGVRGGGGVPVNTALPSISGTVQKGQTLTASPGSWTNAPTSYAYQWQNEGSNLSGAASAAYVAQASDIGCLIACVVTAQNGAGTSLPAVSALAGPVLGATVRYVSSSSGNDSWDGTAASFVSGTAGPWASLAKVNSVPFAAGTSVLFKRGDTWRTDGNSPNSLGAQLNPASSGNATNGPIVFDAYGTGANPVIDGSYDASLTGNWEGTGTTNVWQSVQTFPPSSGNTNGLPYNQANDVGNILWGFSAAGGANVPAALINASTGVMTGGGTGGVWYKPGDGTAHLASQGQWNFNTDNNRVQVYSTTNPATAMAGLSLAIDTVQVYLRQSYITVQNFTLQKGGASPILSENTNNNIIVRDNVLQWTGGGNIGGQSNANSRYGDSVDIEGSADNWLVERNWMYNQYDAGLGAQCGGAQQSNIIFRNNVISQVNNAIASFLLGSQSPPTTANGYYIYNNTIFDNLAGWSIGQRPNGNPNVIGLYPGVLTQTNMIINNNVFAGLSSFGINATSWGNANKFAGSVWLDYNCWPNNTSTHAVQQIALSNGNFAMSSWAAGTSSAGSFTPALEAHGLFGQDPKFTSQSGLNFSPAFGSPLFNAGANLYSAGVVWDINHKPRPESGPFTIGAYQ